MIKRISLLSATSITLLIPNAHSNDSDFITYDWLATCGIETAYTDHIAHFRKLFNTMHVRGFLECGCGFSTKYFMDHSEKVISIEFITTDTNDQWLKKCIDLYKDFPHWTPLAYQASPCFEKAASYQCATHQDYALIDSSYLVELDTFFKTHIASSALQGHPIDVAFVDAGIYLRGDMVKLLLGNKVPVVIAHDTYEDTSKEVDKGLYGWFKVKTPPDYVKIQIPWGVQTTFWIHDSLPHVAMAMYHYCAQVASHKEAHPGDYSYEPLTALADE
ncbi:MAG: hypothetical protein JSS61_03765 [Verrucomicrobia bacterium]|nr:hypothetical protein [Verrucomicrobiota bacterium]